MRKTYRATVARIGYVSDRYVEMATLTLRDVAPDLRYESHEITIPLNLLPAAPPPAPGVEYTFTIEVS